MTGSLGGNCSVGFVNGTTDCCCTCPGSSVMYNEGVATHIGILLGLKLSDFPRYVGGVRANLPLSDLFLASRFILFALLYPHCQLLYNQVWLFFEQKLCGFVDEDVEADAEENLPEHFLEFDFADLPKFDSTLGLNKLLTNLAGGGISTVPGGIPRDSLLKRPDLIGALSSDDDSIDDGLVDEEPSYADIVEEDETELASDVIEDEMEKDISCEWDAKTFFQKISQALYHVRLPDNCLIILIGVIIGGIVLAFHGEFALHAELLNFNAEIVLLILFPPLMLSFSLEVQTDVLLKNAPFILLHSVLGTIIVAFSSGTIFYYLVDTSLDFVHCLLLGIALSSVDPEAVLSVFRGRRLNERLVTHLELETFFKDVVAVVLFSIVHGIGSSSALIGREGDIVGVAFGRFAWVFFFSLFSGVTIGFLAAFISKFARGRLAYLQSAIVLSAGYLAWFLAELFIADGTLGILFAALVMSRYIRRNMSKKSRTTLTYILRLSLLIFASMIFCYCGISMVTMEKSINWMLIICANLVMFLLRFIVIFMLGIPYNLVMRYCFKNVSEGSLLPLVEMVARGTSGMRGAITFALAWIISEDSFANRGYVLTTAVSVIVFTYFIQGPLATLVLHLLWIEKAPLDPQDQIDSWKRILRTLDKITMCVPEVATKPPKESQELPGTAVGKVRQFTTGQKQLRRALGLYIRKGFAKLKSRVKSFRRTMHSEVGKKTDHVFEETGGADTRRSSLSSVPDDITCVDDLGFADFGEGLRSGSSPFLSAERTRHEDFCKIDDLEQSGIRILDRFHSYLSHHPNHIVELNITTGDLDQRSFNRLIEVIRPKLIRYRHYISHYLHSLVEEHIDHKFWASQSDDDLSTVSGGVSSLLHVADHIIQRMLSHSLTSHEKRFVESYVEYRKFRAMKMTLPGGSSKSLASVTSKEDLARAMDTILAKVRQVESLATAELEAIEQTRENGIRRAGELARYVSRLNQERSLLSKFIVETERFRRTLSEVERSKDVKLTTALASLEVLGDDGDDEGGD